jgi:hypothetical protein
LVAICCDGDVLGLLAVRLARIAARQAGGRGPHLVAGSGIAAESRTQRGVDPAPSAALEGVESNGHRRGDANIEPGVGHRTV